MKYLLILFYCACCLTTIYGQVMHHQYHINNNTKGLMISNKLEPSNLGFESFKYPAYIEIRNKKGDRLGWFNLQNRYIYTSAEDSIKIISDSADVKLSNRIFIIPDSISDVNYHIIIIRDSLTKKISFESSSYIYILNLNYVNNKFSVIENGLKLLGVIKNSGNYTDTPVVNISKNIQRWKNYSIIIDKQFRYFELITLTTDSQEIYRCDFSNIFFQSKSFYKFHENIYYLNLSPLYYNFISFANKNIILVQYPDYSDTNSICNFKIYLMRLSEDFSSIDTIYKLDTMPYFKKVPYRTNTFSNSFYSSYAVTDNDTFVYIAYNKEDYNYNHVLEIYQYNIFNRQQTKIFDTTIFENRTSPHGYSFNTVGLFNISNHPSGRLYLYVNCTTAIVIAKPNLPFPYCKVYRNYPILICDSSFYKNTDSAEQANFYIDVRSNYSPIHFNKLLSTVEKIDCNSATLYTNADSVYKSFVWYVWNRNTNMFDSTLGNACYITDLRDGIYYKLKGISVDGYYAWFSDSIYAQTPPVANFYTLPEKHCQYTSILFKDSSYADKYSPYVPYSWHWYFGDGTDTIIYAPSPLKSIGMGSVGHIYNKSGNYIVKLIFYNGLCEDAFTTLQPIYITPAPQPGLTLSPTTGCIPQVFQIKPLYNDTIVSEKYYVRNGLHILRDSFINKPNLPAIPKGFNLNQKDSGLYTIKQILTGATGCITQDTVAIQLNSRPYLKLLNDTFICSDEVLQLAATAGYRYKWNTGDTTKDIILTKAGTYWVKETNGGCTVEDSTVITQNYDEHCKFNISVYPNPFGNEFKIAVYSRTTQNINVQLYEISGKQVASYNNIPVNQFATFSVNTTDLASAIYVLHITSDDKKFTYKIVKLLE